MGPSAEKAILVTGVSGKLGRRIVERLLNAGRPRIIAGTRTPEKIACLRARGVQVRPVDFERPLTLAAAFHGVDRLVMVSTDAIAEPGRRLAQHRACIHAAAQAGVEHVVYTSFARSQADAPISQCQDHHATEQALRASGMPYTALRNSLYAESLLRKVTEMMTTGELIGARGRGGIAYVAREDCARVAAEVVAREAPPIGEIEITGPEVISGDRVAQLVSEITGWTIRYVPLGPEALADDLMAGGMPRARALSTVSFETAVGDGYLAFQTDAVTRLTGRPPISLREFLLSCGFGRASAH